jgi:hypothetical protein
MGAMTEFDKKWYMKYEQLVKFKRKYGHCMVARRFEQDKALGEWVSQQRTLHKNNKIRIDRKRILDETGFAWKPYNFTPDDKLWHQQYEKLVEFKRKEGHCTVTQKNKEDASLGIWVPYQRQRYAKNKMRPDRKKLLDKIGFAWNDCPLAARAFTMNVRRLVIGSFHTSGRSSCFSVSSFFSAYFCIEFGFGSFHQQ